jgi:hypothetical protein
MKLTYSQTSYLLPADNCGFSGQITVSTSLLPLKPISCTASPKAAGHLSLMAEILSRSPSPDTALDPVMSNRIFLPRYGRYHHISDDTLPENTPSAGLANPYWHTRYLEVQGNG